MTSFTPQNTTAFTVLSDAWTQLKAYRELPGMISDSRDHGNFSGSFFESKRDWMRQNEPTGLCEAALLLSMIDATISNITVRLSDVLMNAEFMTNATLILPVRKQIEDVFGARIAEFHNNVEQVLTNVKPGSSIPPHKEMAICLRDALHSIDVGLKLRWVQRDASADLSRDFVLSKSVFQFDDAHAFLEFLRTDMPCGAHLVKVGPFTAISFKQPGCIAFLSSMSINEHSGDYTESGTVHAAKKYDFDQPTHRYPAWNALRQKNTLTTENAASHLWGNLEEMASEHIMWLTMVVGMMNVRIRDLQPTSADRVESVVNALPSAARAGTMLAVREPVWNAQEFSIEEGLNALGFTPWELAFFAPYLKDLTWEFFLPEGTGDVQRDIPISPLWTPTSSHVSMERVAVFKPFNPNVVGTQAEVEHVRRTMFLKNLGVWVMACGTKSIRQLWIDLKPMFEERAEANLHALADLPFATLICSTEFSLQSTAMLYEQNSKRKTYSPLCKFDEKTPATHTLLLMPENSADIALMLGMKEQDLPAWLIGWKRDTGTWSSDSKSRSYPPCPENVSISKRWLARHEKWFTVGVMTTEKTVGKCA